MWKTLTGIFPKVGTPIACRKYTDGQFIKFGNPNSFEYLIICVKSEMKVLQTAVATVTHTADRKRFFMVKKGAVASDLYEWTPNKLYSTPNRNSIFYKKKDNVMQWKNDGSEIL